MQKRRICRLERRTDREGNDLYFLIPSRDRRKPARFFGPDEVPAFEGDAAMFEFDVTRKRWRILRRVD